MKIVRTTVTCEGIRFSHQEGGSEVARAYLYIMRNSLHKKPFGLLEDVFVEESKRGLGYGQSLIEGIIQAARFEGCYKLIATSRHNRKLVHKLYKELGFKDHGKEFRMDF